MYRIHYIRFSPQGHAARSVEVSQANLAAEYAALSRDPNVRGLRVEVL